MALDPNAQANIDPNVWAVLVDLDARVTAAEEALVGLNLITSITLTHADGTTNVIPLNGA